jgi:mRNA-degrading endonuclease RelE of RelBE toxin-antitoxin system
MTPIAYSKRAFKYLKELQPKQAKQIAVGIMALSFESMPQDCTHLSGYPGHFRKTLGEYRVIFEKNPNLIQIKLIGPRNDNEVYRDFKNLN